MEPLLGLTSSSCGELGPQAVGFLLLLNTENQSKIKKRQLIKIKKNLKINPKESKKVQQILKCLKI